jgi:hypothetical protein
MDKLFWNACCSIPSKIADGDQFKMSFIYQQLWTCSILKEPIVVVEGLEIKPYLLGNATCASPYYLLCNFKLVNGNLDKIMFD